MHIKNEEETIPRQIPASVRFSRRTRRTLTEQRHAREEMLKKSELVDKIQEQRRTKRSIKIANG